MDFIKKIIRSLLKRLLLLLAAMMVLSMLLVLGLDYINPPSWMWKLQRQWSPPENYPAQIHHQWVPWEHISPQMKLAVIAAEDQLYPEHYGFDFDSIIQAVQSNRQGNSVRGASTISQQTAKNLFLWSGKSFLRKGIEAWFTALMELMLSKQRILELYLNIVEFGPGILGVEAGSQHYYRKSAQALSRHEAARLAAVLPNPYRFHVQNPSAYTIQRISWIEQQMRQLGVMTLEKIH